MKKFLLIFGFVALIGLIWYLFIKEYDYQFHFETKYGPGVAFNEIEQWNDVDKELPNYKLLQSDPYSSIEQQIASEKGSVDFLWNFSKKNDSVTNVTVKVKSDENQFANRLGILNPFQSSDYIDSLKNNLLDFRKKIVENQKAYSVEIGDEIVRSPAIDCICHHSSNIEISAKASEMVQTIGFLEDYVLNHELKLTGSPFIKVTSWDRDRKLIDFDFCFPVNLAQDIRPEGNVEFRQVPSSTSLKAVFHGNYRISDFAWYDLLNRAEEMDLKTNALPLEVFYNNPKNELNAPTWKAEIFLPIVED